jgi:predicted acyltransferase
VVPGLVLSLIGLSWGAVHPISRSLWSSPYVLLTVGFSLLTVAAINLLLVGRGSAIRATRPLETFGRNALAAYLIHVPTIILATATLRGLYAVLEPLFGARPAALVVVALVLGFVYLPIVAMRRRGIVWRL